MALEPNKKETLPPKDGQPPPLAGNEDLFRVSRRGEVWMFFHFLRCMLPYWRRAALAALLVMLIGTVNVLYPWLSKFLIDDAFPDRDWGLFYRIFLAIIVMGLMGRVVWTMNYLFQVWIDARVSLDLKKDFFAHLQRLSMTFIENRPIGEHMFRANADINAVMRMITDILPLMIRSVYEFILMLAFMTYLDWEATVLVLLYTIPYTAVAYWVASILRKLDWEARSKWQKRDAGLQEGVAGVQVVKTFGRRRHEVRNYISLTIVGYRVAMKQYFMRIIHDELIARWGMIPWIKSMIVRLWFTRKVILGELTWGSVFPIFSYMNRLTNPIQRIVEYWQQIRIAMIPAERILQTMDVAPAVVEKPRALILPRLRGHVQLEHVSFSYEDGRPVLNDITLTAEPGQKIAVVGHSGSGKSTLVNLLLRLYDPEEGRVLVDGYDLREVRLHSYQHQVGLVMQETYLFHGTIRENLEFGDPHATLEDLRRACRLTEIDDFVASQPNGYDQDLSEGTSLSVGQRQRLGIARALVRDPAILVLDEPTSSLDSTTEKKVHQTLKRVCQGRTTFLVTHRLHTVTDADCIYVMQNGRFVESGTHDELMRRGGHYRQMYRLYFGLEADGREGAPTSPPQ